MTDLSYDQHFLVDIDKMTPAQREARRDDLIGWAKRFAAGHANPKWLKPHFFELARLAELARDGAAAASRPSL